MTANADINAVNDAGQTAIMRAAERGEFEIALVLAEYGGDLNREDHQAQTALSLCVASQVRYFTRPLLVQPLQTKWLEQLCTTFVGSAPMRVLSTYAPVLSVCLIMYMSFRRVHTTLKLPRNYETSG